MEIENTIALRPKFQIDVAKPLQSILDKADKIKVEVKEDYRVKVSDHHIFLFVTLAKRKYYSPHLHIELTENEDKTTHVRGLYGPDQTVWTFFMFLHFIVAGVFAVFLMMAYSHWVLKQPTTLDFAIMAAMIVVWFALYAQARINRKKCQPQMRNLQELMQRIIA